MPEENRPPLRFGISELAGSFGDFGTILPISLALAATGALAIGPILLFLGIWFIVTGYYYRYPIPVEPMKAIAIIAVSAGMSGGEIAAAGLILGVIFFLFGFMMICVDLPVAELRQQPPGDASLHDDSTTFMFDTLNLSSFME